MHSIFACLIACRRNHTTRSVEAHRYRFAPKFGIVSLLNRGKEGIHVDVYDFAICHSFDKDTKKVPNAKTFETFLIYMLNFLLLAFLARSPRLQLLEEVVALVIHEDEGREVLNGNLPDSLHAELWVFYALDALDAALRENGGNTTDRTEVETTMLLAGVCYHLTTVALGNHNK